MSQESKKEKEITFKVIREKANSDMVDVIQSCNSISKTLGLGNIDIPNIIIAYNNKIIELEKEFAKAGIDFYDRNMCESRLILENKLQSLILIGKSCLEKYTSSIVIHDEQANKYVQSHKKPSTFERLFKGAKYNPINSFVTPEQVENSKVYLKDYNICYNKVSDFTIKDNMVEAILFYRVLATTRGITDFDTRIDTLDKELNKLGYSNTKDIIMQQIQQQDLSVKNVNNLISIPINKNTTQENYIEI